MILFLRSLFDLSYIAVIFQLKFEYTNVTGCETDTNGMDERYLGVQGCK